MKRLERLRNWLRERDYDGIILTRRDNFTWVTGGNKNHVLGSTAEGIASLVITAERIRMYADSSDALRMEEEQNNLAAEVITVPWYESLAERIHSDLIGLQVVSDTGIADTSNVQDELTGLRLKLDEQEVERYQWIGRKCAKIVEETARGARPGQTEEEIANLVRCRCMQAGISPDCVLVGSDERIIKYRHPMPTDKKIYKSLMIVLGGEQDGLYVSLTRIVYFEEIPAEIQRKYDVVQHIFASMQTLMRDGMSYREYFREVCRLYEQSGYSQEWRFHHQGGSTGYGCREQVIGPDSEGVVESGHAYAWNPTIAGVKCEDTTWLSADGPKLLSGTSEWPRDRITTPGGEFSVAGILVMTDHSR